MKFLKITGWIILGVINLFFLYVAFMTFEYGILPESDRFPVATIYIIFLSFIDGIVFLVRKIIKSKKDNLCKPRVNSISSFVIEENVEDSKYVYKTKFTYFLYGGFILICIGIKYAVIGFIGILIFLYMFIVGIYSQKHIKKIKRIMNGTSISITGSKWSFSNPLTYTIPKVIEDSGKQE